MFVDAMFESTFVVRELDVVALVLAVVDDDRSSAPDVAPTNDDRNDVDDAADDATADTDDDDGDDNDDGADVDDDVGEPYIVRIFGSGRLPKKKSMYLVSRRSNSGSPGSTTGALDGVGSSSAIRFIRLRIGDEPAS